MSPNILMGPSQSIASELRVCNQFTLDHIDYMHGMAVEHDSLDLRVCVRVAISLFEATQAAIASGDIMVMLAAASLNGIGIESLEVD